MGVRNGPPHFQRCVNLVLAEGHLQRSTGAFIDDLMNGAADHRSNLQEAHRLLQALAKSNFRAGAGKILLGEEKLVAMGFVVAAGTISPDPERTVAIHRLQPPLNRS